MGSESNSRLLRLAVDVSDDRLQAWIRLCDPDDPESPVEDEIIVTLKEAQIVVSDAVREKINDFISWIQDAEDRSERFLIAEGQSPVDGKDGEFLLDESLKRRESDPEDDAPVDYHTFNTIVTVDEDAPIGKVMPVVPGKNGIDVHGKSIEPTRRPVQVQLDSTVRNSNDDPAVVIANIPGKIVCEGNTLSIDEVVTIRGDVDFECGNIDASTDVAVIGTILDQFKVESKKSISVRGAIQAAEVKAEGDVIVRGGIIGQGKGRVTARGRVVAKFVAEAIIEADGDITITKEVMNSRVHCRGKLTLRRGAVIGGEVYAREGASVAAIGSEASVPTSVIVGIDPVVLSQADQITKECKDKLKVVERIRESVQPLMANLKRLTPAQKEQATELLFSADSMAAEISEAEARRDQMIEDSRATNPPTIAVSKTVYAGTRVRIGRRHVLFRNELKGPVKIEERKVEGGATEFVAISQASGSVSVLKSADVVDDEVVETGAASEGAE